MRLVAGTSSFDAEDRAIDMGLSLTTPFARRQSACAVILPQYLLDLHPELMSMHPWRWRVPDNSYDLRKDGARICTAEFTFLLLARTLEIPELVLYALEQCGTYAVDSSDPRGFITDCIQRTTAERLSSFLDRCPGAPGSYRARQALRWVADRSASPMESCLTLLLCLPQRLGGFGLPMPELNRRINPSALSSWSSLRNSPYVIADLIWLDARFALEYDSDLEHTGKDRIARDSKRRVIFAAMGIQSISVTNEQVNDVDEMLKIAQLASRALGRRLTRCGSEFKTRHKLLRERLLAMTGHHHDEPAAESTAYGSSEGVLSSEE